MKRPPMLLKSGESRRRGHMARMRRVVGLLFALFALTGILLAYLLDFRRLRADVGRWLVEVDRAERKREAGSHENPRRAGQGT